MKINEEIYRSIIAPKEESDRNIVPLEEVLLIDEAAMRRDLIMNVLNDDPENYIDMSETQGTRSKDSRERKRTCGNRSKAERC